MKIPKTFRLEEYHIELIEAIVETGFKNNTHVVEVAVENLGREHLDEETRKRIFEKHFGTY